MGLEKKVKKTETAEISSGLTLKSLVIGITLVVLVTFLSTTIGSLVPGLSPPPAYADVMIGLLQSLLMPIFLIFLVLVIMNLLPSRLRLTAQEYAIIYSMVLLGMGWGVISSFWLAQAMGLSYVPGLKATFAQWTPDFWTPRSPLVLRGAFLGGAQLPLDVWLIPLFFWISLGLSWSFFLYFLGLIFRKQMIETEKLPFPLATFPIELTKSGTGSPKRPFFSYLKRPLFVIGFIVGFVFVFPDIINEIMQKEFLFSLRANAFVDWLAPDRFPELKYALKGAVVYTGLTPLMFALVYFLPGDILLTQWVTFIFFMFILPIVDVNFLNPGRWREGALPYSESMAWDMSISPMYGVWRTECLTLIGGLLGLALFFLVFNWRYVLGTIKAIVRPQPEKEATEPISYRWMWILTLVSLATFISLIIASGVPTSVAMVAIVLLLGISIGGVMVRASAGGALPQYSFPGASIGGESNQLFSAAVLYDTGGAFGFFNTRPSPTGTQACFATIQTAMVTQGFVLGWSPLVLGLESYKIGSDLKTKTKGLLVSHVLAIVIAVCLAFPLTLWAFYTFGLGEKGAMYIHNRGVRLNYAEGMTSGLTSQYTTIGPTQVALSSPYVYQTIIGMVITGVLMYLHMAYPKFPFNPIGYVLGGSFFTYQWWTAFFVAWLVKTIIFRIGGAKLYERSVPFVVGIMAGTAVVLFIWWTIRIVLYLLI